MAGKKLLVADDSLTIQKVIRLALSNEGYEIQAISDGADALQQISVFRPDLVLIDVSLPTRTAFEIKRELNEMEDFENTRFILMSSAFEKIDEVQADEVKFHGRLTKPFDPAHLRQVLQEVLKTPTTATPPPKKSGSKSSISIQLDKTQPGIRLDPPNELAFSDNPDPTTQLKIEDFEEPIASTMPEISISHHEQKPTPLPQHPSEGISISFETRDEEDLVEKTDPRGSQRDEIKHLTESTIRMSGLDDFDWTVNDSNLKPPVSMDDGGTGFRVKPQFSEEPIAPKGMPPLSQLQSQAKPQASGGNTGGFSRPSSTPVHTPPPLPAITPSSFSGHTPSQSSPGVSSEEVEELVRKQVQETLAEMAKTILPEVCERVIKAEIHRLLNEKI